LGNFQDFIGVDFWTALFVLLNTLTVIFVGTKFLFKPVMKMIESRQKEIDDLYQDAGEAKEQAQAMQKEYQQKLSDAHAASEQIVRDAVSRGQAREEEIIRQANADASALLDKAVADIALEKKKAINDAKDEIAGIALEIAGKVVGRQLSDADQTKLVDQFIDELG
jgi:F-type H+-transporting ATPase subunit b